jgi:hypothetical protein
MKISDKMIEVIIDIFDKASYYPNRKYIKDELKQKGYEVEEEKNNLDWARTIYKKMKDNFPDIAKADITSVSCYYEKAIEEIINKMKNCENCQFKHNPSNLCLIRCRKHSKWMIKE